MSSVKNPKTGNWKIGLDILLTIFIYLEYFKVIKPNIATPENIKTETIKDQGAGKIKESIPNLITYF